MSSEHPERPCSSDTALVKECAGTICWCRSLAVLHDKPLWCQITLNSVYENQPGRGIQTCEEETRSDFTELTHTETQSLTIRNTFLYSDSYQDVRESQTTNFTAGEGSGAETHLDLNHLL